MDTAVRPSALAGSWYPGDAGDLAATVDRHLEAGAPAEGAPRPLALVAPHAGYAYSGATAGRAYARLRGHAYDRVFVLAPSHRARLDRVSPAPFAAYATPLGEVTVDAEVVDELRRHEDFAAVAPAHAAEHAEEIQLPFLQRACGPDLKVVPLLVPPLAPHDRRAAANMLERWCDGRSLFVVSTDFTHYGADYGYVPFTDRIPERLAELDGGAFDLLLARDAEGLLAYRGRTGITMCGLDAAALVLDLPLPAEGAELIAYARSADRDGDFSFSVSYAAMVLAAGPHPDGEDARD